MRCLTNFFITCCVICFGFAGFASASEAYPSYEDGVAAYTAQNYDQSFEIFWSLSMGSDATAQSALAVMYENGQGVEASADKAWYWRQKAIKGFTHAKAYQHIEQILAPYLQAGHKGAQIEQAKLYAAAGNDAQKAQAKAFILEQAEAGDPAAQFAQAFIAFRQSGSALERRQAQAGWLKRAAEQGYAPAQNGYGAMFGMNRGDVKKDDQKKFEWQMKSAAQNYPGGLYNVGNLYSYGIGTEKSDETAFQYYQKAAQLGHLKAHMEVAQAYRHGIGVAKDHSKARDWFQKVAAATFSLKGDYQYGDDTISDLKFSAKNQLEKLDAE